MNWPEGLSDVQAIERLQAILIGACEGNRDLANDRAYKALRKPLLSREDLSDVVPQFVRTQRDLNNFWAYIRKVSEKWQPRREHVWTGFRPLFDRLEGKTQPKIDASRWTGRRTKAQQALIVRNLCPDALQGVELLLDEWERPLHNGGPVDAEQQNAIDLLRELHAELGELLRLLDAGEAISAQLTKLKNAKDRAFNWSAETYRLTLAGTPLAAASAVVGCGVVLLINAITKGAVDANMMGAAVAGVHATYAYQKGKSNDHQKAR